MNKSELIAEIAENSGLTKKDAESALDAIIESITKALSDGDEVKLIGFGTFSVTKKEPTTARNPRTGEEIKVPAKTVAKFKPGQGLKDSVA